MMLDKLFPTSLKIDWQATAHGKIQGDALNAGSNAYWEALQPHRKLDQVSFAHH